MSMGKPGAKGARVDAGKAAQLEEQIRKEFKILGNYLKQQEEAGLIHPRPPTPPRPRETGPIGTPELIATMASNPNEAMNLNLSRNLWVSANPGYTFRDAAQLTSVMKTDYVWDEEEIDFMKAQGDLDKRFNRKRDDISQTAGRRSTSYIRLKQQQPGLFAMGAAVSREKLPPAEQVTEGPYDLRPVRAPILTGLPLRLFIWFAETSFFGPILDKLMRDSGLPQVLSDIDMPEHPTFYPLLSTRDLKAGPHEQDIQDKTPSQRTDAASTAIPGFRVIRSGLDDTFHTRRWSTADYHQAYSSGEVTPAQVAANIIKRIRESEAADPPMRFMIAHDPVDLLRQAEQSTARYKAGKPLSILDGVPYCVKDAVDALPYPTTEGTTWAADLRRVTADAHMVAALRSTGAVLIGKANLHEIGMGTTGMNIRHGTARNPHNPRKFTGGSSAGSAAAVAAGLCPFAVGTDGGGSIRLPAAFCGCVGLKPTYGRDPNMGSPEAWSTVAVLGPIAATVEDAMIMYAATANIGQEAAQFPPAPATIPRALFDPAQWGGPQQPLKGKRIGVYRPWFEDADEEVVRLCKHALLQLESSGAEVVPICVPELELLRVAHIAAISSDAIQEHQVALRTPKYRRQINNDVRLSMRIAERFTASHYLQAQQVRTRIMVHLKRIFTEVDLIATPTTPISAPLFRAAAHSCGENDLERTVKIMRYTLAANFCGNPAISVPVGHSSGDGGMPVGLQLMGRPWAESELLFAGSVLEAALAKQQRMPQISYDVLYDRPFFPASFQAPGSKGHSDFR
ncbi:hypothetical protein WJX72_003338 [[Myrmecia] bisecta]|uniref:Amidase domain-containing protein n=1 Tax=[Myrmecia] bisecta TaxID=41462 RepID=A0AAW1PN30_9CHLO